MGYAAHQTSSQKYHRVLRPASGIVGVTGISGGTGERAPAGSSSGGVWSGAEEGAPIGSGTGVLAGTVAAPEQGWGRPKSCSAAMSSG